jgi:hypothetical protein
MTQPGMFQGCRVYRVTRGRETYRGMNVADLLDGKAARRDCIDSMYCMILHDLSSAPRNGQGEGRRTCLCSSTPERLIEHLAADMGIHIMRASGIL